MPARNPDLHGSAPDTHPAALLLIDVVNDFDFPEADAMLPAALAAAERIAALKAAAKRAGVPVVYVNDNFGRWRSDLAATVEHCRRPGSRGRDVVERLLPADDDYFVLKPKHSGFFASTLETLLRYLECRHLVLAGYAGNICVLFTANDATMRDFALTVPRDCVASNTPAENGHALGQMASVLRADTPLGAEVDFARLGRG